MPQGLQIFDAAGNVKLDIGTRVLKFLTVADLTIGTPASVPYTPPAGGSSSVGVTIFSDNGPFTANVQPNYSVGGSSIDFTWPAGSGSGTVRAGIFVY